MAFFSLAPHQSKVLQASLADGESTQLPGETNCVLSLSAWLAWSTLDWWGSELINAIQNIKFVHDWASSEPKQSAHHTENKILLIIGWKPKIDPRSLSGRSVEKHLNQNVVFTSSFGDPNPFLHSLNVKINPCLQCRTKPRKAGFETHKHQVPPSYYSVCCHWDLSNLTLVGGAAVQISWKREAAGMLFAVVISIRKLNIVDEILKTHFPWFLAILDSSLFKSFKHNMRGYKNCFSETHWVQVPPWGCMHQFRQFSSICQGLACGVVDCHY